MKKKKTKPRNPTNQKTHISIKLQCKFIHLCDSSRALSFGFTCENVIFKKKNLDYLGIYL